ncbi:DoxX family protein [Pandoraea nosoerga]|uniref:GntR family transcriptional regulator n=1 Tax=Pandoraea nosoerga TaxID=2508296 RepID=A0A5E4UAX9_9BURK|nr:MULTISPECIES: DoxX family protein [Pandoraea]MBN4667088.1 DoxX family protein [Pandoraea nosoerga]MBN4677077.1 DoxX family protein [Pandoraea nosoerga]MBN4681887.1 DoxX family protein [Pandoraea nosoerga]MBN4746193.1 DoxX family protein [Pandoraea nosoerga]VVD96951.1 GntR family transcriptional regulator [Pandoraea nosoerga]
MQSTRDDLGKLILRLTLGILLLFHGVSKVINGVGFIEGMITSHGLPGFLAYGAYLGEVLAPVLLILGVLTRLGGLLVVANMLVAFSLVHLHQLGDLAKTGGWALELQGFYLFAGLCVMLFGAGRYSVSGGRGAWD